MKTEKEILKSHSKIIKPDDSLQRNLMSYGLCCHKGWYDIIDEALTQIENLELPEDFEIFQIKEKFGTLRIYTNASSVSQETWEMLSAIINTAEEKASHTCEECGYAIAKTEGIRGWYRTICENCKKSLINKEENNEKV